ncbi:sensor histidine kinase [Paenibacillus soyae]|uniref:histidine kinase n=1 Tax=Paenibacillus soyae TaxID=2969249 RepID=A0A9X2MQV5_9BACL|nr:histidine kinase [Paenibacillus soyae]MCR2806593.1 histidine kinase [Paenibacillus soyae]
MDTRKKRLSTLLWILICSAVFMLFLPPMLVERPSFAEKERPEFTVYILKWQVAYGQDEPEETDWETFDLAHKKRLIGYEGTVWLRKTVPDIGWRSPYLFFSGMKRFEVTLGGEPLYSFNMDGKRKYINPRLTLHPVPIEPSDEGKELRIKTEWAGQPFVGSDMVLAGEPDQLLYAMLQGEVGLFIYAILYLTASIVGLILFVRRRQQMYGWFGILAFCLGLNLLLSCRVPQWFLPITELYYWRDMLIPIGLYAFVGFFGAALQVARNRIIRVIKYVLALYVVVVGAAGAWDPILYARVTTQVVLVLAGAGLVAISYVLIKQRNTREREEERRWIIRGFWTLALCTLAAVVLWMLPLPLNEMLPISRYIFRIIAGLQSNGLLLFMICMIMVMVSSVRRVHLESERNAAELLVKNKELEQFHRDLEKLVEMRTAELEQANRVLSITMREKAESLAELSVLEERNRIAYEIHDVVGHTLTAAIVQLEATKTLAERDGGIPEGKLDMLSGLVRKGLDDIRKSVRLLKTEEAPALSLEESLRELIQYTEDTMDIRVEADIRIPHGFALGKLSEQVLYHALQEGLTNGIRHGRCSRFRFTLQLEGELLKFRLVSDGEPFGEASPGFGLSAMKERAELLGGTVSIRSSSADDGSPCGCELSIELPVG